MKFIVMSIGRIPKLVGWCEDQDKAEKKMKEAESNYPRLEFDIYPVQSKTEKEIKKMLQELKRSFI